MLSCELWRKYLNALMEVDCSRRVELIYTHMLVKIPVEFKLFGHVN